MGKTQGLLYWAVRGEVPKGVIFVRHGSLCTAEQVLDKVYLVSEGTPDFEYAFQPPFRTEGAKWGLFIYMLSEVPLDEGMVEILKLVFGPETRLLDEYTEVETDDVGLSNPVPELPPGAAT